MKVVFEHTELTNKIEEDSLIESELTTKGVGRLGMEGLSKKEKGLMDMGYSVVTAGVQGDIMVLEKNTHKEKGKEKKDPVEVTVV